MKRNIWREPKPQKVDLIPSMEGVKRFDIGRDELINYGDVSLEEVKEFLRTIEAFSVTKRELSSDIYQSDDLDFNKHLVEVRWYPSVFPWEAKMPKKRNGSLKWNEAKRYSRMSPFNQLMRKIGQEIMSPEVLRARLGLK